MSTMTTGRKLELSSQVLASMQALWRQNLALGLTSIIPSDATCPRFDDAETRYVIAMEDDGRILACTMLRSASTNHMPTGQHSQSFGNKQPRHLTWELLGFVASVCLSRSGRVFGFSNATLALFHAALRLARQHQIEHLTLLAPLTIERLILRVGLDAHRISPPESMGDTLCVTMFLAVPVDAH